MIISEVWLFNGSGSRFASGVFSSKENAETWIKSNGFTGTLTLYPLDQGTYDWAVKNNFFVPKKDSETSATFIQNFTSASQEHYHYENGFLEN